jgi:hypothetical protein
MNQISNHAPNLTQRPPRSPLVRLGGYVVLARILDKGRAELASTAGEFKYHNPGDYHWFRFTGITPEALKAELAMGKGDGEMLAWIEQNAPNKHTPWEIQQLSMYFSERGPDSDGETLEFFTKHVGQFSKTREDLIYSTSTTTSPSAENPESSQPYSMTTALRLRPWPHLGIQKPHVENAMPDSFALSSFSSNERGSWNTRL